VPFNFGENKMQIAGKKERVKLIVDLTRYNSNCKIGELGWTMPNVKLSMWGSEDRFVAVRFDNGAMLDVLYKSLEVIRN
jgi:hypothetical protein